MSCDRLQKSYERYSYRPVRLMKAQPSERKQPSRKRQGAASTHSCCHASSVMLRSCLGPGPCWGNRQGRCPEQTWTTVVEPPSARTSATECPGKTARSSASASSMIPGYLESSENRRLCFRPSRDIQPSPR